MLVEGGNSPIGAGETAIDTRISVDTEEVSPSRGTVRRVVADHGRSMTLALVGLVALGAVLTAVFGPVPAAQVVVTLLVPAGVMVWFWSTALSRIEERQAQHEIEGIYHRATGQFVADWAHELVPHPERCNLRAEALVVAVDYHDLGVDLKVVVPDMVAFTDPALLRQMLHVFVANAVRHGGTRIAIWATAEDEAVRLTVSDDGPGLPDGVGERVFERFVDLGAIDGAIRRPGSGLAIARGLSDVLGGRAGYRRDPSWTHFSVTIPVGSAGSEAQWGRVPLGLGAR